MAGKLAIGAIILLVVLISTAASAADEKDRFMGLGIFGGTQICDNPVWHTTGNHKWNTEDVFLNYGWKLSPRWEIYLEGNIGLFNFHSKSDEKGDYRTSVFSLGASIMTSYDFIRYKDWGLFGECGVGPGYWHASPNRKLVQPDVLGLIQYGAGLKIPVGKDLYLRPSYRFIHHSSIPGRDTGANTHGFLLRITKYFK